MGWCAQWQYVSNGKCVVVPTILIILTQYLHSWHNVNLNDEISMPNLIRGGGGVEGDDNTKTSHALAVYISIQLDP